VRRVVAVGDSVTWAKGVDQDRRYTELLDATLGDGVEVWNFGVEGSTAVKVGRTLPTLAAWEPDLVVWQASANDSDLTAWRLAEEKPMPRTGIVANQILARSQLLLRLSYWLAGDPFARFAPQLRAATAQRYGDAVERVFDSAAEAGWPVVVLTLAYATGEPYGQHVAHGCRARPDVCLGVVQVDFEGAAGWLGEDPAAWATPSEVWRAKAALSRRVDDRTLPLVFPWSGFFHDIVHPNDRGHRLMAAQLARFLEQGWLAPAGPAPGSPAPSRTSLPPTPAGAP
jgi:lysophospholipase L1-like esterase